VIEGSAELRLPRRWPYRRSREEDKNADDLDLDLPSINDIINGRS
jgi:hypothetical protein